VIADARGGVLDAGELLSRRLRLGFESSPGGDEVVLGRIQARISQDD
jgi:hypothetical protein